MNSLPVTFLTCAIMTLITEANAQSFFFSTIAGTVGATGGTDGTNTDARFNYPSGLAVDTSGNLYVADLLNHTIRKISPRGTNWVVTTIAGLALNRGSVDGTNSDARFDHPMGIAVDPAGNVFVADKYNDTIRKLTPQGTNWVVTTIAGSPGVQSNENGLGTNAHFWGPSGISFNRAGNAFIVDSSNHTIRGMRAQGTDWLLSTIAGTPLNFGFQDGWDDTAQFNYPYSIAVGPTGELFVTDWGNQAIRELTASSVSWYTDTVSGFSGVPGTNDGPAAVASFNSPTGIAVDAQTNLYTTDYGSHTIRKLSPAGGHWTVSTIAGAPLQFGSADGAGSDARFYRPWGIAFDRAGTMYVADYRNQTIRRGLPDTVPLVLEMEIAASSRLVISWPVAASAYELQTASSLESGAVWTSVTSDVFIEGSFCWYTNQPTAASAFFRLHFVP